MSPVRSCRARRGRSDPACSLSAVISLSGRNRLHFCSRSSMRRRATSRRPGRPPTTITCASLPMARKRSSAAMAGGVRLGGRRPGLRRERVRTVVVGARARAVVDRGAGRRRRGRDVAGVADAAAPACVAAASQPVSTNSPAAVAPPAMRRARRAGCGRLRRGGGGAGGVQAMIVSSRAVGRSGRGVGRA